MTSYFLFSFIESKVNSQEQEATEHSSKIKKLESSTEVINELKELLVDISSFIPGWLELGLKYQKLGDRKSK